MPDPTLAVELRVLEAPFQPGLGGVTPSYNNMGCSAKTPQHPEVGIDFDPFTRSLLECICLSPLQLSQNKLQTIWDSFGKETCFFSVDGNLRCEPNSNPGVFLVKTALKQCPAGLYTW